MSKRAEQRALEEYPDYSRDLLYTTSREYERTIYVKGYKQAEKDLALTWQDIRTITKILEEITNEDIPIEFFSTDTISGYKEVLRKFKEAKQREV